jgi:ornithine carbamoyltransferase
MRKRSIVLLIALIAIAIAMLPIATSEARKAKSRLKVVNQTGDFPTNIKKIGIVQWSTKGANIVYTYPQKLNWPRLMADSIQANLTGNYPSVKIYNSKKAAQEDGCDLIITGRYVSISQGSRGARMWVGYGAGAAGVDIEGEMASKKGQVTTFSTGRRSASSMEGVAAIQHCISSLGYDIASYVLMFR